MPNIGIHNSGYQTLGQVTGNKVEFISTAYAHSLTSSLPLILVAAPLATRHLTVST